MAAGLAVATLGALAPPAGAATGQVALPPTPVTWTAEVPADWPSPPPASARSYILVDALTDQVLASRAADDARIVASTVKLLTVVTALETLDPDDEVVVGPEAAVGGAGTSVDPGETWRVSDLLDAVLVRSGNDAARALAEAAGGGDMDAFVGLMRDTALDLGLQDATIVEPTGLDDANELSARDLATVARVALADDRVRAAAGQARVVLPDVGAQDNRNLLIGSYPGATGLKTGFTELAGYCLVASAVRDGRELVAVVLGAREDPARFEEAAALLDHGFERLHALDLEPLRARRAGGWVDLLPSGRVWAPTGRSLAARLQATPGRTQDLEVRLEADGRVLGTASASLAGAAAPGDGAGATMAEAMYAAMRRGHVAGLWPGAGGADTAGVGSG